MKANMTEIIPGDHIIQFAENCGKVALDISGDQEAILAFASQDSYKKRIEIIASAEDMTTKEKLEALNQADDRFAQDVQRSAETCRNIAWNRYLLLFSCLTGVVLLASSPEGSKAIRTVFKRIA